MSNKLLLLCTLMAMALFFSGCASSAPGDRGIQYPPTDKAVPVFQKNQIPDSCRVFAQLLVTLPAQYTGEDFAEAVSKEAMAKGADMVLIGQSRQCTDSTELTFTYYGLDREYKVRDWPGWIFGMEEWEEQGAWANIGYQEWGNSTVRYDYPIVMQMAFLRCQSDS